MMSRTVLLLSNMAQSDHTYLFVFEMLARVRTQVSDNVNIALFARKISKRVNAARKRASISDTAGTRPGGGGVIAFPR